MCLSNYFQPLSEMNCDNFHFYLNQTQGECGKKIAFTTAVDELRFYNRITYALNSTTWFTI